MSRGFAKKQENLARELRHFQGLSSSFYRAVAGRIGMTVSDMQVIDTLQSMGAATAGQIAEIAGLTTGAIAGMLNRLEEAGIVVRERDPVDGRRVIVRLVPTPNTQREIDPLLATMSRVWQEMTADYNDEQLALLLKFLQHSNALFRQEIFQLREVADGAEEGYSMPLDDLTSGQLVVVGSARLAIRAEHDATRLYSARFEGPVPEVKAKEETVTMRYPRRLWGLGAAQRGAEIMLNATIPWRIAFQSGAAEVVGELGDLTLAGLEIKGAMNLIRLELPTPSALVPLQINGVASEIRIHRPAGVAARVHLKGWVSHFVFDEQSFSNVGNDVRLQSVGYNGAGPYFDIEITSSASNITITAG